MLLRIFGDQNAVITQWSLLTGIRSFGSIFGIPLSSFVNEKFGRKGAVIISGLITIFGAIIAALFKPFGRFYLLIIGRFLMGFSLAISILASQLWITELAQIENRGFFASFQTVFFTLGNLAAYMVTMPYMLGTQSGWYISMVLSGVVQLVLLPIVLFLPDSPRHIFFKDNHMEAVLVKSITFYHGEDKIEETLNDLNTEGGNLARSASWTQIFQSRQLWYPVLLSVLLTSGAYFAGISSAIIYSTYIQEAAGVSNFWATQGTVLMTGTELLLVTFCMPFLMESIGRKVLCFVGFFGCFLVNLALMTIFWSCTPGISMGAAVSGFLVLNECMQGVQQSSTITATAEILPQCSRSKGLMIGQIAQAIIGTILVYIFMPMSVHYGMAWAFMPYAVGTFLFSMLAYWALPETRMTTFEEISREFTNDDEENQPLLHLD